MPDKEPKYYTQVQHDEHDNSVSPYRKRVQMYGWDADNLVPVRIAVNADGGISQPNLAVRVAENSGDSNIIYIGQAAIGSATDASVWRIKRVNTSSGAVIDWLDGDSSFDNTWDDRESGSYS